MTSGLCACGCGQVAPIAARTNKKLGHIAGQPTSYVLGHNSATIAKPEYAEEDRGYKTPCWIWQRALNNAGYGRRRVAGGEILAHRHAWEQEHGPVPEGRELDHLCSQHACVRPSHLEPVTHAQNIQRGRRARFTLAVVEEIRRLASEGATYAYLGRAYETDRSNIRKIVLGERWA